MENPNCKNCWYWRNGCGGLDDSHGMRFCHFQLWENIRRPYKWLECPGYKERITKNESDFSKPGK